ncbi:MAG: carbohydrate ABC transporter permease [Clostridiales bacterium]|nr:carbohydrate ABC transporter permease [Clostridiales bacterium]
MKRNFGIGYRNRIFHSINYLIFFFYALITFYPFLFVVLKSIQAYDVSSGKQRVIYNLSAYEMLLANADLYTTFLRTIFVVIAATTLSIFFTILTAYPLSRKHLKGRIPLLLFVIIPMLFSGGLIPTYILIRDLNLRNNILVYIIPGLISSFNVVIAKNFLQGIPDSVEESAKIDGANDYTILFKIFVPLSKPIIATLALWVAVGKWNDWMTGVLYIKDKNLLIIQNYLRIVLTSSYAAGTASADILNMPESLKMASIVVGTLPILIAYPFLQKYFVKGMILGSIKG